MSDVKSDTLPDRISNIDIISDYPDFWNELRLFFCKTGIITTSSFRIKLN